MEKMSVQKLCVSALLTALVCVTTAAIQIPIPLGYMHLGNVMILIAGVFFGPAAGMLAGGIGSALADLLTGYGVWALPTLLIKSLMGYAIGRIAWGHHKNPGISQMRVAIGNVVGILIMIAGYTVFGGVIYGSAAAGISQVPGLSIEGILAIMIFYGVSAALSASKVTEFFARLTR